MALRVLVCGGRTYSDEEHLNDILDRMHRNYVITEIIHGGANGADKMAGLWACSRGIDVTVCPAAWERYGKAAGHIRNKEMLELNPDIVIAFPGGRGTSNMLEQAFKAGVKAYALKGRESFVCSPPQER